MWSNEQLIDLIVDQQKLVTTMLEKMKSGPDIEQNLEEVIANQRKIDHLIDQLTENATGGMDTLLDKVTESADTAGPDERSSAS